MSAAVASAAPAVVFDAPPLIDVQSDNGAVGDFNEDDRQDIALLGSQKIHVLFGSEDGRHLGSPVTVTDGGYADRIRVGDFDADGHADLLITSNLSGIQVVRGRGDGTFHPTVMFPVWRIMAGLTVADFNGDGRSDLAIAYREDPYGEPPMPPAIGIHLASADGTLADPILHPIDFGAAAEYSPITLAVGDFDGDGNLDLTSAGRTTDDEGTRIAGGLKILFGGGDGTLSSPVDGPDGLDPDELVVEDFNGDNRSDLAVRVNDSSVIHILPGQVNRTIVSTTQIDLGTAVPYHLATADMNADGAVDLLSIGLTGVQVMTTDAAGAFTAPVNYQGVTFGQLLPGDFNGDGRMDLAVRGGSEIIVLAGQKRGMLPQVRWTAAPAASAASLMVGNVIGDRRPDLIIGDDGIYDEDSEARTGLGFLVLRGLRGSRFASPVRQDLPDRGDSPPIIKAIADFNGDGMDDVAVQLGNGDLTVWFGGRKGVTAGGEYASLGAIDGGNPVAAGRFNADRRSDLVVAGENGGVRVLIADPEGRFAAPIDYPTDAPVGEITAGDFDGNGTTDVISSGPAPIRMLPGNGDGTFAGAISLDVSLGSVKGDFNRDGSIDFADSGVMFSDMSSGELAFKPGLPLPRSTELNAGFSADFNRDRILDLGNTGGWIWMGLNDGTFSQPARVFEGSFNSGSGPATAAGDFNRDGRTDLAVLDQQGVRILLNRTKGSRPSRRPDPPMVVPDASFGEDGIATATFAGSRNDTAAATVVQPDGKIILGGRSYGHYPDFALVRLNPDGTPDLTFGEAGKVITPVALRVSYPELSITSLALQPDGKIVAAGRDGGGFFLARYTASGQLDAGFATGGIAILPEGAVESQRSDPAVAVAPDGRIAVAVSQQDFTQSTLLVRYDSSGTLDPSFGTAGVRVRSLDGENVSSPIGGTPPGLAIAADGKILVADALILSRFATDGADDLTFGGGDGRVGAGYSALSQLNTDGVREHLALLPNGKILIARLGLSPEPPTNDVWPVDMDLMVQRYSPDGTLDKTFGANGRTLVDVVGDDADADFLGDRALGMAVEPDGGVIISTAVSKIVRLTPNGERDTAFGFQQVAIAGVLAARPAGGFVSAGTIDPFVDPSAESTTADFVVTAFTADGTPDSQFGADGTATVDFIAAVGGANSAMAAQPDGKLVTVGISGVNPTLSIVRYHPDGSLDPSFSADGSMTDVRIPVSDVKAVAVQPDGRILAAGSAIIDDSTGRTGFFVARYNPDGTPDSAFGAEGWTTTDFGEDTGASAHRLTLLPDGKILAVGDDGVGRFALARYTADGQPDLTFGTDGQTTTLIDAQPDDSGLYPHSPNIAGFVMLLPDGRFVVEGATDPQIDTSETPPSTGLARYNADGTLDATFGRNGTAVALVGSAHPGAAAALPDGRIVIAGLKNGIQTLAAFNPDGTRDTAFGVATGQPSLAPAPGSPRAVLPVSGGKLLVVSVTADSATWGGDPFASGVVVVTRYNADGSPDTRFGTAGRAVLLTGGEQAFVPEAFTLSADGHLLMTGSAGGKFALAKYRIDR